MSDASHLSPRFLIPIGTQVVLRRDHGIVGGTSERASSKKRGSVGEVVEAPLTNDYSYTVRFADGSLVRVRKEDLAIRRSDAPEAELEERGVEAYEEHVIYKVRMGSHAFGLADDGSDVDERGVFLTPAEWHWSLQPLPEQVEFKVSADGQVVHKDEPGTGTDVCWWELEKFLKLAIKANPNILEILHVPDPHMLHCDAWGRRLRNLRDAFLSRYLFQTYSGYVLSQFRKMQKRHERGEPHRTKHAMHLIRLLHSGIAALRGEGILVDVGEHRAELLSIKRGDHSFDEVHALALELNRHFQEAYAETELPERPDVQRVDEFLIEARRHRAGESS